jgi:hypothetical protein
MTASTQADVGSPQVLIALSSALDRFKARGFEAIETSAVCLRDVHFRLEQCHAQLSRDVEEARSELEGRDADDDNGEAYANLQAAQEALANLERWQRTVNAAEQAYESQLGRFSGLLTDKTSAAQAFLRRKLDQLERARSVAVEALSASAGIAQPSAGSISESATYPIDADAFFSFRLPPGFAWVPFSKIDVERELRPVQDRREFKKVHYDVMRLGMESLRNKVLPAISANGTTANSEYFRHLDEQDGIEHQYGSQVVYDAFFGHDRVVVEKELDNPQYNITNGKHRIKIALDLGWPGVPAEIRGEHL